MEAGFVLFATDQAPDVLQFNALFLRADFAVEKTAEIVRYAKRERLRRRVSHTIIRLMPGRLRLALGLGLHRDALSAADFGVPRLQEPGAGTDTRSRQRSRGSVPPAGIFPAERKALANSADGGPSVGHGRPSRHGLCERIAAPFFGEQPVDARRRAARPVCARSNRAPCARIPALCCRCPRGDERG